MNDYASHWFIMGHLNSDKDPKDKFNAQSGKYYKSIVKSNPRESESILITS